MRFDSQNRIALLHREYLPCCAEIFWEYVEKKKLPHTLLETLTMVDEVSARFQQSAIVNDGLPRSHCH